MGKSILGRFGIAIALIAEIALFAVCSPYFFSSENFLNVSLQISITAIIAVGMTLVILTAGIDLSVGALVAFTVPGRARALHFRRDARRRAVGSDRRNLHDKIQHYSLHRDPGSHDDLARGIVHGDGWQAGVGIA